MAERVAITGMGIVTAAGAGADAWWQSLREGASAPSPISLFDTSNLPCKKACQVNGFDYQDYFGVNKLLRHAGRSTRFLAAAMHQALQDAGLDLADSDLLSKVALVGGTTFGPLRELIDFEAHVVENPRSVDPVFFPNTVASSPLGFVSQLFKLTGYAVTLSTGYASGVDAVGQAVGLLSSGRAQIALVAACESLSPYTYRILAKAGLLSGSKNGEQEGSAPLDRSRNGFFLGEGGAVLVLEPSGRARRRGADIRAEIASFSQGFANGRPQHNPEEEVIRHCLDEAELEASQLSYVAASANGSPGQDRREAAALCRLAGGQARNLPVSAIKSMIGECGSVAGLCQMAAAALSMRSDSIPPTVGFAQGEPDLPLDVVAGKSRPARVDAVLVNAFSDERHKSALVLQRPNGIHD